MFNKANKKKRNVNFNKRKNGNEVIWMRCKNGNPKKSSRFICLKCMQINPCGSGIQRGGRQRERYHIKDLMCLYCSTDGEATKNMEIRWCDMYEDVYEKALEVRNNYYDNEVK